ncbi:MAG: hypothetical protein HOY76_08280 [Streptomyces sp.]|nr:hypothetical protein [Streptomyces sp.]
MTTTPRTWIVGEVVTAALLNTEIRDQFNSFFGAWTTYTPEWGAESGTAPAIGNGTRVGRYLKVGRTVDYVFTITMGSTTTYGNGGTSGNYWFGLPVAPASSWSDSFRVGQGIWRLGNVHFLGSALYTTTFGTTGSIYRFTDTNGTSSGFWDSATPLTLASGDSIHCWGRYEAAS